jgi:GGDEF domain-containing protein
MKLVDKNGAEAMSIQKDIVDTYIYDAADRINKHGADALNAFADGDELKMMHVGLKRFTKVQPFNSKAAKRRIAEKMTAEGQYNFS